MSRAGVGMVTRRASRLHLPLCFQGNFLLQVYPRQEADWVGVGGGPEAAGTSAGLIFPMLTEHLHRPAHQGRESRPSGSIDAEPVGTEGRLYYAALRKGLEHLLTLVSAGVLDQSPVDTYCQSPDDHHLSLC